LREFLDPDQRGQDQVDSQDNPQWIPVWKIPQQGGVGEKTQYTHQDEVSYLVAIWDVVNGFEKSGQFSQIRGNDNDDQQQGKENGQPLHRICNWRDVNLPGVRVYTFALLS